MNEIIRNESDLKPFIIKFLKQEFPDSRIVDEVAICNSICDFIIFDKGKIIIVEVKSDCDNLKRLNAQIEDYKKVADKIILILSKKFFYDSGLSFNNLIYTNIIYFINKGEEVIFEINSLHRNNISNLNGFEMLDKLHCSELKKIIKNYAIKVSCNKKRFLVETLYLNLSLLQIKKEFYDFFSKREFFNKLSILDRES